MHIYFSIVFVCYLNSIKTQNITIDVNSDQMMINETIQYTTNETDYSEKLIVNLNHNCTADEDCNVRDSICDNTLNTCECDITTIQLKLRCKTIHCQSSEECMTSFPETSCIFGRCQCTSGRKIKGKCVKSIVSGNPLPDWAVIFIALSIALSALFGGTLKRNAIRKNLLSLIRIISHRHGSDHNSNTNSITDNHIDKDDNEL